MSESTDRRPIKARNTNSARSIAGFLAGRGVTPNQISVASVVVAIIGSATLFFMGALGYIIAAICIQMRLLCNLFDGMVAVEYDQKSPVGALFNEFPDRVADSLFIVAAGYAAGHPEWGWAGALLAALTAYVRVFGASCGLGHDFRGPMAKQHRMALLTIGLLLQAFLVTLPVLYWCLMIIAAGSALTCVNRTVAISTALKTKGEVK